LAVGFVVDAIVDEPHRLGHRSPADAGRIRLQLSLVELELSVGELYRGGYACCDPERERRVHPCLETIGGIAASTEPIPENPPDASGLNFW